MMITPQWKGSDNGLGEYDSLWYIPTLSSWAPNRPLSCCLALDDPNCSQIDYLIKLVCITAECLLLF